jgi:hypothetical protein
VRITNVLLNGLSFIISLYNRWRSPQRKTP